MAPAFLHRATSVESSSATRPTHLIRHEQRIKSNTEGVPGVGHGSLDAFDVKLIFERNR